MKNKITEQNYNELIKYINTGHNNFFIHTKAYPEQEEYGTIEFYINNWLVILYSDGTFSIT